MSRTVMSFHVCPSRAARASSSDVRSTVMSSPPLPEHRGDDRAGHQAEGHDCPGHDECPTVLGPAPALDVAEEQPDHQHPCEEDRHQHVSSLLSVTSHGHEAGPREGGSGQSPSITLRMSRYTHQRNAWIPETTQTAPARPRTTARRMVIRSPSDGP